MYIFCNKPFKVFLENQISKNKPTPLLASKKCILLRQGPVIFFTHSHLFLCNIWSMCLLFFYFSPNDSLSEAIEMLSVSSKRSFHSWNIQIFVFLSSHIFLPIDHCFRERIEINLKVFDVISCLSKNLITYFIWYLEKGKRYDIETLSLYRLINKEHFHEKFMLEMCTKS